MAEDKTLYVIFGIVAVVALVAMIVLLAPSRPYANNTLAGQAFSFSSLLGNRNSKMSSTDPVYLGPPETVGDEWEYGKFQGTIGGDASNHRGQLEEYIAPLKNCVRSAADDIKIDVQTQCDPRTCIDQCSAISGSDQEALKSCGQGCMEDFKTCTTQHRDQFNTEVRDCAYSFAPDPINECTDQCDATTTTLNEFTECSRTCINTNWVDPAKACVDQCRTAVGNPTTQDAAEAAKDQFTQCANTCLADFEQYI